MKYTYILLLLFSIPLFASDEEEREAPTLPPEMLKNVLKYIDSVEDRRSMMLVCKQWRDCVRDEYVSKAYWKKGFDVTQTRLLNGIILCGGQIVESNTRSYRIKEQELRALLPEEVTFRSNHAYLEEIAFCIERSLNAVSLNLSSSKITDIDLDRVRSMFTGPLVSLEMINCDLTDAGALVLADILLENQYLSSLNLNGNQSLTTYGMIALLEAIALNPNCRMSELHFYQIDLSAELEPEQAALVTQLIASATSLREISLTPKISISWAEAIFNAVAMNQSITTLRARNSTIILSLIDAFMKLRHSRPDLEVDATGTID